MTDIESDIPLYASPIIGKDGRVTAVWWRFFLALFNRTGGSSGVLPIPPDPDVEIIDADTEGYIGGPDFFNISRLENEETNAITSSYIPVVPILPDIDDTFLNPHGIYEDSTLHAIATPSSNGFMSSTDKSKLDGITDNYSIVTDVVATNSTADVDILTFIVLANGYIAGDFQSLQLDAFIDNGAVANQLDVWIKIGVTKVFTQSLSTPSIIGTGNGLSLVSNWTVRSLGATGEIQFAGSLISNVDSPAIALSTPAPTATAVDTTANLAFTIGMNWTSAAVDEIATVKTATVRGY